MNSSYQTPVIIATLIIILLMIIGLCNYCFKKLKKIHNEETINSIEYKLILKLSVLYILLEVPPSIFSFLEYNRLISGFAYSFFKPLYLIINIIPVYIAILLFYRKYYNPVHTLNENNISTEEAVKRIFDSNSFYNAISTSLPIGNKNEDYGFDYIPFMLQNLIEKRKRFKKSSMFFLTTTICLSLFFVSITIFFGYILLNESSIGIYKEINNLNSELTNIDKILISLKKDLSDNDYIQKNISYNLMQLGQPYNYFEHSEKGTYIYANLIRESVENFNKQGDFNQLYYDIETYRDSIINFKGNKNNKYNELINNTYNSLTQFKKFRDNGINDLNSSQNEIKKILPKIQEEIQKPINTQNELIKRLILSVVIISFFIAILRYFRGLYQSHHNEMLNAEHEDLSIRKFYVTYKSSNSPEERKQVLSTFLSLNTKQSNSSPNIKNQDEENAILKEVISTVLKKF